MYRLRAVFEYQRTRSRQVDEMEELGESRSARDSLAS